MLIYRICRAEFATTLTASGFAGRWNQDGQKVLYASATRSLAALELFANCSGLLLKAPYCVMVLDVPVDSTLCRNVDAELLPSNWQNLSGYGRLQEIGASWYRHSESLILKVPSVLIPQECNYLVNTQHADFEARVRLVEVVDYNWDRRLV